jgi:hypothetical protein
MSDATTGFWKVYERTVAAFFAPTGKADGLSERAVSVANAERRTPVRYSAAFAVARVISPRG